MKIQKTTILIALNIMVLLIALVIMVGIGPPPEPHPEFNYCISWGLGVHIKDDGDGGPVDWGTANEVEVQVTIPDISTDPSRTIFAILSVYIADNYFLQVGAHFGPGYSEWRTTAQMRNFNTGNWGFPAWVDDPGYNANDTATFKIWSEYVDDGGPPYYRWNYSATNEDTGSNSSGSFLTNCTSGYFQERNQPILTLESKTIAYSDFSDKQGSRSIFRMLWCKVDGTFIEDAFYTDNNVGGGADSPDWLTIKTSMYESEKKQVYWLFAQTGGTNEEYVQISYALKN
ncbi:MAG: hypothetical protein ACFFCQ_12290 [Promethearchaeota archaeon]